MQDYLTTVRYCYPSARATGEALNRFLKIIKENLNLLPSQIALADSLCCDEVNNLQFPRHEMIGPFKLGGLGGYPFSKLTGMAAFAGHIPDDGAALIFYGPHIGITREGAVGKIARLGQERATNCCGSVSAALDRLQKNQIQKEDHSVEDYQQKIIEQILLDGEKRIKKSDKPVLTATQIIYEAIDRQIEELISKTKFPCKHIIRAGGIFINSDSGMNSFWETRRFEVFDMKTKQQTSLRDTFFEI